MDLAFTPEEQKFAADVRAFVKANLPADVRDKVKNGKHLNRDDYMRWQQALGKKGWLVYTWPKKHGGPGFTPAERYIFENICAEEYAPGHHPVRHQDGRAGDLHLRQRRAEGRSTCRRSARAPCGGARATPSRARAPISRRCAPRRRSRATTTSSTARRPGTRWATGPTGSSAWCAPTPRPSRRKASPSC